MDQDAEFVRIKKRLDVLEGKAPGNASDPNLAGDQMRSIMGRLDHLEAIERDRPDIGGIVQRLDALETFRHRIEALAGAQPEMNHPGISQPNMAGAGDERPPQV